MTFTLNSFAQSRFWIFSIGPLKKKGCFKLSYGISIFLSLFIFMNKCIIYQNMSLICSLFNTCIRKDTHLDVYPTATKSVLSVQGNIWDRRLVRPGHFRVMTVKWLLPTALVHKTCSFPTSRPEESTHLSLLTFMFILDLWLIFFLCTDHGFFSYPSFSQSLSWVENISFFWHWKLHFIFARIDSILYYPL